MKLNLSKNNNKILCIIGGVGILIGAYIPWVGMSNGQSIGYLYAQRLMSASLGLHTGFVAVIVIILLMALMKKPGRDFISGLIFILTTFEFFILLDYTFRLSALITNNPIPDSFFWAGPGIYISYIAILITILGSLLQKKHPKNNNFKEDKSDLIN